VAYLHHVMRTAEAENRGPAAGSTQMSSVGQIVFTHVNERVEDTARAERRGGALQKHAERRHGAGGEE